MDGIGLDEAHFDQLVSDALDALPEDIAALMSNVAVTVEDEPPPGQPLLDDHQHARTARPHVPQPDELSSPDDSALFAL